MHATFNSADSVGVPVNSFVIPGVPLDSDVQHLPIVFFFVVGDLGEQCILGLIEMLNEVNNPALVLEGDVLDFADTFILENNF